MSPPGDAATPVAYQSLYRRFRPQRFDEVLGQDHVSLALRNAVRDNRVSHAYLFSGPRGTGKTSSARILAKALNCEAPVDGEPCGVCSSCREIAAGSSLDVHELDAASNNGVEAMRELVSRAALGTPGRWKVYIIDEVHMLSTAASNALLKTLEEPPGHVVFVLATTDPQKVLPTIKSRTQHYEFRLLGPETLEGLIRQVRDRAGLEVTDAGVEAVVRRGRGSARDALSALDQLAAGGGFDIDGGYLAELAEAICERDANRALVAMASAVTAGRDPQAVAGELAEYLRQGFLSEIAPELVTLTGGERDQVAGLAERLGLPAIVRAIEVMGRVQVDLRDAPDPRVHVEVALIRLTRSDADDSPAALLERLERLERTIAGEGFTGGSGGGVSGAGRGSTVADHGAPTMAPTTPGVAQARPSDEAPAPEAVASTTAESRSAPTPPAGPNLARKALGAVRREQAEARAAGSVTAGAAPPGASDSRPAAETSSASGAQEPSPGGAREPRSGGAPSRDELVQAWGDGLLAALPSKARARFKVGRFMAVEDGVAVYGLPNTTHRDFCDQVRSDVEAALSAHFGVAVPLRLVVDPDADALGGTFSASSGAAGGASPAAGARRGGESAPAWSEQGPADDEPDLLDPEVLAAETEPAGAALSATERLKLTFPGAEEV